jgi:ferredoxin-NADP reductase
MAQKIVKVKSIENVTHDVLQIVTDKPRDLNFTPGQAVEISINKPGWENEIRPFSFTCLPDSPYLEFIIKTYPSRKGVTNELLTLKKHDEFILREVFGAIAYRGEGVFIAGGAGVTPFICILRYLQSKNETGNNKLIFANKTHSDIILEDEFKKMLGKNLISILSDETVAGYPHGMITESFLKEHVEDNCKNIYICGPQPMIDAVENQLSNLGIGKNAIIKEDM